MKKLSKTAALSFGEVLVAVFAVVIGAVSMRQLPAKFSPYIALIGGLVGRIASNKAHWSLRTITTMIAALGGTQAIRNLLSNPDGSAKIAALSPVVQQIPQLAGLNGYGNYAALGMGDVDFDELDEFALEDEDEHFQGQEALPSGYEDDPAELLGIEDQAEEVERLLL